MRLAASWCNVKLYHLPRFSFPHSSLIVLIVATRGGLRWRDTDLSFLLSLSLSLFPSARVSFLLTYAWINAPSRSYLRRIVVRRDEILWRRIIDGDKRNFLLFFSFSSWKVYTLRYRARKWYNRFLFFHREQVEIRTRRVYNTGRL